MTAAPTVYTIESRRLLAEGYKRGGNNAFASNVLLGNCDYVAVAVLAEFLETCGWRPPLDPTLAAARRFCAGEWGCAPESLDDGSEDTNYSIRAFLAGAAYASEPV